MHVASDEPDFGLSVQRFEQKGRLVGGHEDMVKNGQLVLPYEEWGHPLIKVAVSGKCCREIYCMSQRSISRTKSTFCNRLR